MFEFFEPLSTSFMMRALFGGMLVAVICAIVGTWAVIRGMIFLGEAMAHGLLPGVALAGIVGLPAIIGAYISASVMSLGVGYMSRRGRHSQDTSIGLFFVGMLALGVIIVSHSRSAAIDLTSILFGDILAISNNDILLLAIALAVICVVALRWHRAFVALTFDRRVAHTLGLRPRTANVMLVVLVTIAVVFSYGAVGSLLVVGLLVSPVIAASYWVKRIPHIMLLASIVGCLAVVSGLLVSWYWETAAGATIVICSILVGILSSLVKRAVRSLPSSTRKVAMESIKSDQIS
ncbi:zinc ABC transporter permease AztB [Lysinibacter sp. HNR]|uniref:zinc ABC transporter permease AztB n=1 Tax=Lysinibacter sp. HNR TaxID=3031408 RepID=UPI002435F3D0|nr:zinc ABC transporter permease AztB [Lysinibacter sp. HNR]WGD37066.1 zinc ABC transporter permease AztB [Lysinibacter sp. HNR]